MIIFLRFLLPGRSQVLILNLLAVVARSHPVQSTRVLWFKTQKLNLNMWKALCSALLYYALNMTYCQYALKVTVCYVDVT